MPNNDFNHKEYLEKQTNSFLKYDSDEFYEYHYHVIFRKKENG